MLISKHRIIWNVFKNWRALLETCGETNRLCWPTGLMMSLSVLVIRMNSTGCSGAGDISESRNVWTCRWSEAPRYLHAQMFREARSDWTVCGEFRNKFPLRRAGSGFKCWLFAACCLPVISLKTHQETPWNYFASNCSKPEMICAAPPDQCHLDDHVWTCLMDLRLHTSLFYGSFKQAFCNFMMDVVSGLNC